MSTIVGLSPAAKKSDSLSVIKKILYKEYDMIQNFQSRKNKHFYLRCYISIVSVLYLCHISVVLTISCHNFLEITYVVISYLYPCPYPYPCLLKIILHITYYILHMLPKS